MITNKLNLTGVLFNFRLLQLIKSQRMQFSCLYIQMSHHHPKVNAHFEYVAEKKEIGL